MTRRLLASLLVLVSPALAQSQHAPVVFTGVSVIPMDRDEVLAEPDGDRRARAHHARRRARSAPAGATIVDGRGKFLMPGIAEFHAHVPSGAEAVNAHRTLTLYVLAGVTTARGMLGAPMHLALRDSIAKGQVAWTATADVGAVVQQQLGDVACGRDADGA